MESTNQNICAFKKVLNFSHRLSTVITATSVSYGNWKLWFPVKLKPLNRWTHNLSRLICRQEKHLIQIWWKSVHGGLLGNRVKYNFLVTFFLDQCREQTHGWILTRIGSKDAESHKDVPFGGYKKKIEIWPLFTP